MARKQAVVLIHGIGEQKPMETLRQFVETVWLRDTAIHNEAAGGGIWSKPDFVSNSFELRRLTTPRNEAGIRTDFFEFYWAHLMHSTKFWHLIAWGRSLLFRSPGKIPHDLRFSYWVLILTLCAAIGFAVYAAIAMAQGGDSFVSPWLSVSIAVVLLPVFGLIMRSTVGDAARYLHLAPPNVQRRHEIRRAGIELLDNLHTRGYERIIVVGHSLGSVIGYDILTHAWVGYHKDPPNQPDAPMEALNALESRAAGSAEEPDSERTQAMQRAYHEERVGNGHRWRVTDLITLGSPLAHAALLLAKDADDLERRQQDREYSTCLPALETRIRGGKEEQHFSFELNSRKHGEYRIPHHAAVFASTRWTNLYFPSKFMLGGDLIGGPLRSVFGQGVRDVRVSTTLQGGLLSHPLYWTCRDGEQTPSHIHALRDAVDLTDRRG